MDRVAPERCEKFMVPSRLEYWTVILNLKSVASVKRTRLAADLFVHVITDRVYSGVEIYSSNFVRTWSDLDYFFPFSFFPRNFETIFFFYISTKNTVNSEKNCQRRVESFLRAAFRSIEFLDFSDFDPRSLARSVNTRVSTPPVSTRAHSPAVR